MSDVVDRGYARLESGRIHWTVVGKGPGACPMGLCICGWFALDEPMDQGNATMTKAFANIRQWAREHTEEANAAIQEHLMNPDKPIFG